MRDLILPVAGAVVAAAAVTLFAAPPAKKPVTADATSTVASTSTTSKGVAAPPGGAMEPQAGPSAITGAILETMDSGGYTYMKIKTTAGDMWTAVNQTKVTKGQTVTIVNPALMENFESKTLHRKFDKIVFGTLGKPGAGGGATSGGMPPGHPAVGGGKPAEAQPNMAQAHQSAAEGPDQTAPIKVAKAEGTSARTIAELHAQAATLTGKEVAVRGKVVKYTPEVMGKNWIHIRDGSGSHAKKDDDLTVTTMSAAQIGDVVLVKGVVKTNRDFGAGYAYPVIIEDAKVSK